MAQPTPAMPDHLSISTSSPASNSLTNGASRQPKTDHSHIWLITGPAGCGKSTVAQYVANSMNLPYIEGDEYHPKANIDKMAKGIYPSMTKIAGTGSPNSATNPSAA
ncbi:hypothetical protein DID88_003390 [Monilinia fructigena]|uniref:gluconokinase n=1 Tax=Monilinia fructigena TaxID=38457 RepID=A0A395IWF2_9HELO|nr:hypothetical protein DID88_003390 [Monilinia fructigena]